MSSIVVIDTHVEDWSSLAQAWGSRAEVVLLDAGDDALAMIAGLLEAHDGTTTLHLASHGAPGRIELGSQRIDTTAFEAHRATLARFGAALGEGGEVLLYGCRVPRAAPARPSSSAWRR